MRTAPIKRVATDMLHTAHQNGPNIVLFQSAVAKLMTAVKENPDCMHVWLQYVYDSFAEDGCVMNMESVAREHGWSDARVLEAEECLIKNNVIELQDYNEVSIAMINSY